MTTHYAEYSLGSHGSLRRAKSPGGSGSLTYGPPQGGNTLSFTTHRFRRGATVAGPITASIDASSSTPNLELMADVYDVAPDGTQTQIAHGGTIASMRRRIPSRSWRDSHGRLIRPYLALRRDRPITPGRLIRYAIPIQPTFTSLAPGHRIRLQLASQPDPSLCMSNGAKVVARVIGCLPRPAALATLAGGRYTIRWGGRHRSTVNLPLMPRHAFTSIRSGITPTSNSVVLPLDWSSPR
jgi:hypothetical protein